MIGPKEKKERALGERLQLKGERCASPKCAAVRKPYRPGMHGQKRKRGGISEFGRQLQEKTKFKLTYGVDERNLRKLFEKASRRTGSTTSQLMESLESRLDNVVFRLGFAPSRLSARQMVVHGHVMVSGRRVRSPGFAVKVGDIISIRESSRSNKTFEGLKDRFKKYEPPEWLLLYKERVEGKVVALPKDTVPPFEINLLVESFSK